MYIAKDYPSFLAVQLELFYNLFKIHTMTVRNWVSKLFKRSQKVDNVFFVTERDKGDFNNKHVHMLLDTNNDMTYKEVTYGWKYFIR